VLCAHAVVILHANVACVTNYKKSNGGPMDKNENFEVISVYTQDQAIEDGVLVLTGHVLNQRVVFTSNLFYDGYEDPEKRIALVKKGLEMLRKDDPEDTRDMRLMVIEKNEIWVIWNAEGFTFMKPEDY